MAFMIGDVILLLKPQEDWYAKPTEQLNPRITLEVKDAYATEKALRERGITISDPVTVPGANPDRCVPRQRGKQALVLFRFGERPLIRIADDLLFSSVLGSTRFSLRAPGATVSESPDTTNPFVLGASHLAQL